MKRVRWTTTMLKRLHSLLEQGMTHVEAGAVMGLRKPQVASAVAKYGLGKRGSQTLTRASFEAAAAEIAQLHDITLAQITGRRRMRPLVYARQHLMQELRDRGYSFPQIAARFGMHHTNVMWGVVQHRARLADGTYPQQDGTNISATAPNQGSLAA